MIKKFKTPCCPNCRYKYKNHNFSNLIIDDLQTTKCKHCKKAYYIIIKEDGYICFTNFHSYHNYICH